MADKNPIGRGVKGSNGRDVRTVRGPVPENRERRDEGHGRKKKGCIQFSGNEPETPPGLKLLHLCARVNPLLFPLLQIQQIC